MAIIFNLVHRKRSFHRSSDRYLARWGFSVRSVFPRVSIRPDLIVDEIWDDHSTKVETSRVPYGARGRIDTSPSHRSYPSMLKYVLVQSFKRNLSVRHV